MTYSDYRERFRALPDRGTFYDRFAVLLKAEGTAAAPVALALSRAQNVPHLSVETLRMLHAAADTDPAELIRADHPLPGAFRTDIDAEAHAARFVQEFNELGKNNPLFYAAYLVSRFLQIAPFPAHNEACALALCDFYLLARNAPPILFFRADAPALREAIAAFRARDSLQELSDLLAAEAEKTAEAVFGV